MRKFVLSSSKGLAETTRARNSTVQFIHESVREFFLKDGLSELWPNITATEFESISHSQLQQCCHAYVMLDISNHVPFSTPLPKPSSPEAKQLRSIVFDKFPFLEYGTRHILYHAEAAANGFPQDKLLEDFPLESWIYCSNIFKRYEVRRYSPTANLLYILAENNFPRLIKTALRLDSRIDIPGERYHYPFFAALAHGHQDAIKALLQKETGNLQDDVLAHLEFGTDFKCRRGQTPLLWAVENGHKFLVKLLLEKRVDKNMGDKDDWILLERAVMQGHESVVRVLLDKEVDVNMKKGNGQTLLSLAIEKGNESAVRVLLDNEAHPNVKTGDNRTPLSLATEKGHKSLAKILLDKGADLEARDNKNGWTPLLWAVASAYERAPNRYEIQPQPRYEAQRLGLQDYQMQLMMLEQQNRKKLIATENPTAIFKLLLEKGANVDVKDEDNQTPLSWAARKGQEPIYCQATTRKGC